MPRKPHPKGNYCPKCGADTKVVDSRHSLRGTKRRRECVGCTFRFSTIEITDDPDRSLHPQLYTQGQ